MYLKKVLIIAILVTLVLPSSAQALGRPSRASCHLPVSNAEALIILNNETRGYWWDHTHLTVAVKAHQSATPAQLDANKRAIAV